MRNIGLFLQVLTLAVSALVSASADEEPDARGKPEAKAVTAFPQSKLFQLAVELRDGSRVAGEPNLVSLAFRTPFAKTDIPLKLVNTIEFPNDGETVKVTCTNGDALHGTLTVSAITLKTSFGTISVPLKNVVRISTQGGLNSRGLVLYYNFDTDEGSRVTDQSGKGHHGTVEGAEHVPNGYVGGAYSFDGNSWITAGDILNLDDQTTNLTVCAWVKAPAVKSGWSAIVSKQQIELPYSGWLLYLDPLGKALPVIIAEYPEEVAPSSTMICDDEWHFLCAIFQVANDSFKAFLYIDGMLKDEAEKSGSHGSTSTRSPLTIGQMSPNGDRSFRGLVDEVRIYDRQLSASEIDQLYRQAVSLHPQASGLK